MSCRDRDVQSLIRVRDRNRCNFTVQMHHTHASARTHARAGTLNMTAAHGHKTRATRSANLSIHTARSMRPQ